MILALANHRTPNSKASAPALTTKATAMALAQYGDGVELVADTTAVRS